MKTYDALQKAVKGDNVPALAVDTEVWCAEGNKAQVEGIATWGALVFADLRLDHGRELSSCMQEQSHLNDTKARGDTSVDQHMKVKLFSQWPIKRRNHKSNIQKSDIKFH